MNSLKIENRNVLIFTHNYEGGSKVFLDQYIEQNYKNCGVYIVKSDTHLKDPLTTPKNFIWIDAKNPLESHIINADAQHLNYEVQKAHITEIFVNHLIHFNLQFMVNWIISSKLPFAYMIHDYHCVCMNYRLDCGVQFCHLSAVKAMCRHHLDKFHIWDWRNFWGKFLSAAKRIITPSNVAANVVKNIYPNLSIEVRPHYLTAKLSRTFKSKFATREKLRITFLGKMFEHKGEEYLLRLNEFIRSEKLPVEFVVVGEYVEEVFIGTKEGVLFGGGGVQRQRSIR